MYSLGGQTDVAMIETLVHFDPTFSQLTYHGVPDIRVIVYKGYPVMAMSRLPTRLSHGKANLHQGAIGVASYRRRSFPPGLLRSTGYMNRPPWRRVRWMSATREPM